MADALHKLLFEGAAIRAQAISLTTVWQEVKTRGSYPPAVEKLLGELLAAGVLLAANLKFDGSLLLQMRGHGPIRLAVVECRSDLSVRATIKLDEEAVIPDDASVQTLLNRDGQGRFIVVLDPQDRRPGQAPYQGIVPLIGDSVAQALEHYMASSEQLETRLYLACDADHAAGVLLQKIPQEGGTGALSDPDAWNRATQLAATLKQEELLGVDAPTVLRRLFWEETVRVFDPLPVSFRCTCSRHKVANMLLSLGQDEAQSVLEEQGKVQVRCDYCGKEYTFDAVEVAQLFATGSAHEGIQEAGTQRH